MRILFLLSCLEPAGSETYCTSLAEAWRGNHDVFWISDRLHYGQAYAPMPIHRKAFPAGVANTVRVAQFIRRNGIQLIHSHSRRSRWVAAQAAALTRIPHVTTIHQPPPVHFFSRAFPCFGNATLAIDEAVADHLTRRFRVPAGRLHLIRNGISLDRFKGLPKTPSPLVGEGLDGGRRNAGECPPAFVLPHKGGGEIRVLLLGRLSGGRWKAFEFFLDVLKRMARSLPPTVFQIAGRVPPERAAVFSERLQAANAAIAPSRIEPVGFIQDLPEFLRAVDVVVAGGRSALESLASAKPVIMMGEGGVIGACNPETWEEAQRTNFGDHLVSHAFYPATLELALRELLATPGRAEAIGAWGRSQVEKYYDIRKTAKEVEAVYGSLLK